MKFFIDTTDIDEITEFLTLGIVDGVTTNPTLIANSGRNYLEVLTNICALVKGPVSAEVTAVKADLMVEQGLALCKIAKNIVVKLPCTWEGIKACNILAKQNIPTNLTLCFTPMQALMAAKAGATFISPFVGRLDDISQSGMDLIKDIFTIYSHYENIKTQILVASVRTSIHVIEAAKLGADVITLSPKLVRQLVEHPLTDKGLSVFLADWEKSGQKIVI